MAWDAVSDRLKGIAGALKGSAGEWAARSQQELQKALESALSQMNEFKPVFQDTFQGILQEISGLKPILAECGFVIGDINVTLPMPPEFIVVITQSGHGKKSLGRILEEQKATMSSRQKIVLRLLVKANELAQVSDEYNYCLGEYELVLALPPRVIVHLVPKEPSQDLGSTV